MKYIELSKGEQAICDDDIYDYLVGSYSWVYSIVSRDYRGYAKAYVRGSGRTVPGSLKYVYMHHLIAGYPLNNQHIDHINRNTLDNRRENLRVISRSENGHNSGLSRNNTSGLKGVSYDKKANKWNAEIMIGRKRYRQYYFDTAEEAYKRLLSIF